MGEVSDSNGDYTFNVECGKTINIRAEKTDYKRKKIVTTQQQMVKQT
jgi:hypothetical protein